MKSIRPLTPPFHALCSAVLFGLGLSTALLAPVRSFAAEEIPDAAQGVMLPPLETVKVSSSIDGHQQPVLVWAPESATSEPRPILIFLHSWSANYKQDNSAWQAEAVKRGWIYLHPDFRGPNFNPDAGGSLLAQQDILDALAWAKSKYKVDPNRVYLAGSSGGGFMTLLMAGRYGNNFSAASAWVPISDLAEWYRFHTKNGMPGRYAQNVASMCGGAPGASVAVDEQYRNRSPLTFLKNAGDLPVDINAGVHDGWTGSVPITHSLLAFNEIAAACKSPLITPVEIKQLREQRKLSAPTTGDTAGDATYIRSFDKVPSTEPCKIFLRRHAGPSRVTIFDGGHVAIPSAACQWLEQHSRATASNSDPK